MIVIHWLSALAVFGLFALGLWMTGLTYYDPWYHRAPDTHRSIGALLLLLTTLRLLWQLLDGRPQELPEHLAWEKVVAKIVHIMLYLLLLAVIVSGYLISTAHGRPNSGDGWFELPATLYGIEGQEDLAGELHLILAWSLLGLALLHGAAALKHHFIDRDRTLKRMVRS
jgi:cytochrome b561